MNKQDFRAMFGAWLKAKRILSGKTILQVADLSGVGKSHVSEIERGIIGCTMLKGIALAEAVDCKLQDFINAYDDHVKRHPSK